MPRAKMGRKKKERLNQWQPPLEQLCCVSSECDLAGQRSKGNLSEGRSKWRLSVRRAIFDAVTWRR